MNEFMKKAKELADDNVKTKVGGPFGAVIVKDGKIIGEGSNHVIANCDPTAHAEIIAIREACKNLNTYDLTGCEIYTSCYPCPMCLSAIIWANITKVCYGNTKEDAEIIGFRDKYIYDFINGSNKECLFLLQMDRDETLKTFDDYLKDPNKTEY